MSGLADRVRERRESLGLALESAAAVSDLSAPRWSAIEGGDAPTVWELRVIAGALAVEPNTLRVGSGAADIRWSGARFRAPQGIEHLSGGDVRTLAKVAEAARVHAWLRGALAMPASRVESCRSVEAVKGKPWEHGYRLGKTARELLHPKHEAIGSMAALCEALGVLVVFVRFDASDVEGASLFERGASPAILLNVQSSRVAHRLARRAVIAHELCHLLHDSTIERDLVTLVSRSHDTAPVEQRANGFAPSFIAPKHWVKVSSRATAAAKIEAIGETWGLSFEGAAWHAKNLRLVSPKAAATVRGAIVQTAFEEDVERIDPGTIGIDVEPSYLGRSALGDLAVRAAAKDVISTARASEILTMR